MSSKPPENKLIIRNSTAEFLIFTQQAGESGIEVRYEEGTIWLTQKLMAELFDVTSSAINQHLKNIFASGELVQNSVIKKFLITAKQFMVTPHQSLYSIAQIVISLIWGSQVGNIAHMARFLKRMCRLRKTT